jgi:hypothetical protein
MTGLSGAIASMGDPGEAGGKVRVWTETIETTAADSATSTYTMARLPSNARILGQSTMYFDALGGGTIHIGVHNPPSRSVITNDPDGLSASVAVTSAGSSPVVSGIENYGKRLWEFVSGQTADPKGQLDVKLTVATAITNAATITLVIYYTLD